MPGGDRGAGARVPDAPPGVVGRWHHRLPDGRVQCDVCPRECRLREGQRGYCFVRQAVGGEVRLTTYGRNSGMAVDPVEKKPLWHFLPGSRALSFGTAGCNLGCRFCQNWELSTSREWDTLGREAEPGDVAAAAMRSGCASVAYTYNDPTVFAEYAIDCAQACRDVGVRSIAVSAGWISAEARGALYGAMDAANIDLKGFTDDFYSRVTGARLADVLDTLVAVAASPTWLEVTTLLIPGLNDDPAVLRRQFAWMAAELGADVPLHLTAFHPAHRMRDVPPTTVAQLRAAREIALGEGVRFVYTGNVRDLEGSTTWCPGCGEALVVRDRYVVGIDRVDSIDEAGAGTCPDCRQTVAGVWR